MRTEQGVQNAVHSFHRNLDAEALRCSICPDRPAVWWVRHSHIKLSTFAGSILMHTGHVNPKDVVLYAFQTFPFAFISRGQSDCARYRVREYDTNRDPRGPLAAGAEVLYGMITDLIVGVGRFPGQIVGIFPGSHHETTPRDYRGREWAMAHFAESLSNQRRMNESQTITAASTPGANPVNSNERVQEQSEIGQSTEAATNERGEHLNESHSLNSANVTHSQIAMERGDPNSSDKKSARAKHALSETRYHAAKSAKYALNFVLVLPTDLTLSLTKGFHNAPKLYHDKTVESIPKVMGVKSGFRAAGEVS